NYNNNLTLVSRKLDNAVLEDPVQITEHVVRMIKEKKVKTIVGDFSIIEAGTLCIHGDNPHAVEIVSQLTKNLKDHSISIE
ncbi:MAG: LamB/YcsF family protein, partial [Cyclobacteriaceae bacterium]